MTIPEGILGQAEFLMAQKEELERTKKKTSKSLLSNVLDLNDELIFVAGENFHAARNNRDNAYAQEMTASNKEQDSSEHSMQDITVEDAP